MAKKKDQIFYIIIKGGYVEKPIVKKIIITPQEIEDAIEEGEEEEDALQYLLGEIAAGYEQGWSRTIIFDEKEFESVKQLMASGNIKILK